MPEFFFLIKIDSENIYYREEWPSILNILDSGVLVSDNYFLVAVKALFVWVSAFIKNQELSLRRISTVMKWN